MNIQLRQRLVGAVVLVALAVIFIPVLLPGEGDLGGGIENSNIPPEPDFRFPPVPVAPVASPVAPAPVVPVGDDDVTVPPEVSDKPVPAEKVEKAENTPPEKPPVQTAIKTPAPSPEKPVAPPVTKTVPVEAKPVETGQVSGWVVQVGSFAALNNARALRDKLRKRGHASFVESINNATGRVYRVRVGPELSKLAADKLRQRLAKESGLKGLVQVYP